jgi:hypothetical protein
VPAADVGDLRDGLRVQTRVNGHTVQDGTTDQMVYTVGDTLSLISRTLTIRPGDLLATGTPSGVGYARTPPWLLQPGDEVEVEVDRLGVLRNTIVDNKHRHPPARSQRHRDDVLEVPPCVRVRSRSQRCGISVRSTWLARWSNRTPKCSVSRNPASFASAGVK